MKRPITFIAIAASMLFQINQLNAQKSECGFKDNCICEELSRIEESFETSDYVVNAHVLTLDTLPLAELLLDTALQRIQEGETIGSFCAQSVLKTEKVLIAKVKVKESFKGGIGLGTWTIVTPLSQNSCGYKGFALNKDMLLFGTKNTSADIYFTWNLGEDIMHLKNEYAFWTNTCKWNILAEKLSIETLRGISE